MIIRGGAQALHAALSLVAAMPPQAAPPAHRDPREHQTNSSVYRSTSTRYNRLIDCAHSPLCAIQHHRANVLTEVLTRFIIKVRQNVDIEPSSSVCVLDAPRYAAGVSERAAAVACIVSAIRGPHQEADERLHGLVQTAETANSKGQPEDAQFRDFKAPWSRMEAVDGNAEETVH